MSEAEVTRTGSRRIADLALLVGAAFLVSAGLVAAFAVLDALHGNPIAVFVAVIAVVFVLSAKREFRREFRSPKFIMYACFWAGVYMVLFVVVLSTWGWLFLVPAFFGIQVVFYLTTDWLFGARPARRTE